MATKFYAETVASTAVSSGQVLTYTTSAGPQFLDPSASTGSGTPGGAAFSVQYNSTSTFFGDIGFTYLSSGAVTVGSTAARGSVAVYSASGLATTIQPSSATATWTLTLPSSPGTADFLLKTDGAGVTSWATPPGLEVITASRTYYVRQDGDNNNTGLVNSSGGAWRTIQYALDFVSQRVVWDQNDPLALGAAVVQISSGTWDEELNCGPYYGRAAGGYGILVQGYSSDISSVIIRPTTNVNTQGIVTQRDGGIWTFEYMTLDDSGVSSGGRHFSMLDLSNNGVQYFGGIHFIGSTSGRTIAVDQAYFTFGGMIGDCQLTGNFDCFVSNTYNAGFYISAALTLNSTPNFNFSFLDFEANSQCFFNYFPITGTATGRRFTLYDRSTITSDARFAVFWDPNDLPGDQAGFVDPTSQYQNYTGNLLVTKTSDYTIPVYDSQKHYNNIGSTQSVSFLLPEAVVGDTFSFCCGDTQTISAVSTSAQIAIGAAVSTGGTISSTTLYSYIEIEAISTAQWITRSAIGTWAVT